MEFSSSLCCSLTSKILSQVFCILATHLSWCCPSGCWQEQLDFMPHTCSSGTFMQLWKLIEVEHHAKNQFIVTLKQQLGERIGSNGLVLVLCTCIRWHHAFKISTVSFSNEQFCWIWMFNILHWKFVLSKCAGGIIYCTPFNFLISIRTFTLCLMMRKWFFNRTFLLCKFSGRICLK